MADRIAYPRGYVLANLAMAAFAWVALVYLVLPQAIIVPLSLSDQSYLSFPPTGWSTQWYHRVADNPAWRMAAWNSMLIGVPVALLSMVLGTLAALAASRGGIGFAGAVAAVFVAPMMLPHVILAIGLYPLMLSMGFLSTHLAAIVGHTVVGMPLVFITVNAALARYSVALELAAMTLGATPWATFWKVTFPIIRPGVLIGGILAFATSFDELMLSLFLTGPTTRTLPRLIWEQLNDFLTPAIAAAATLIFLFTLVMLLLVAMLQLRAGRAGRAGTGGHG
ncbi:MAG: ABC transporter permease [Gemmobacter sp.]